MAKLTPFNILFNLNKNILHSEEDVKASGLNYFLLVNFIRTCKPLLPLANYLNNNHKMPLYQQYLLVYFAFIETGVSNVKWVKSDKALKIEDIDIIRKYYYVNYRVAISYLEVLQKEDIDRIKEFYKRKL